MFSNLPAEHARWGPGSTARQAVQHVLFECVCVCVSRAAPAAGSNAAESCAKCGGCCCLLSCLQRLKHETYGRLLVEALVPDFQVGWWVGGEPQHVHGCVYVCTHTGEKQCVCR